MLVNPAAVYRQTAVETSSPGQLIILLYRHAIRCAREGVSALEQKDLERAHGKFVRAQEIVFELGAALNSDGGPVASSLEAIYEYFHRQLTDANLRKDPEPARQVAELLESLLEAWEEVISPRSSDSALVTRISRRIPGADQ